MKRERAYTYIPFLTSGAQRFLVAASLMATAMAACISNQAIKYGDAAAVRGDWKAAEREYQEAIAEDPGNRELVRKYIEARARALDVSLRAAAACHTADDAVCVHREVEYALSLDPGNATATTLRAAAHARLAVRAIDEARQFLASNDLLATWRLLDIARDLGVPAESVDEVARLDRESTARASEQVRSLLEQGRAQRSMQAIATLTRARELVAPAAARDPSLRALAAAVDEALASTTAAEVAVHVSAGDNALAEDDFDTAAAAYERALKLSDEPRIQRRATYARAVVNAQLAIPQHDYQRAADHLRAAIATGEDHRGAARALLDGVQLTDHVLRTMTEMSLDP